MNLVQKARAKLMISHPFFASLLMSLDAVETRDIPTLATDMKKIYYNPDFVEQHLCTTQLVMAAFAHEVMHVCLEHGLRLQSRNHVLWNIAGDFAINYILKDSGFELGEGWLYDAKLGGKSADEIYDMLQKQADKARKGGGSGKPGEGGMPGLDGMHGPDGDLIQAPANSNPAQVAETRRGIQQKVAAAAQMARMAGQLKGELERLVGEILDPKVPWPDLLRDYMTRITKDDETWAKRNRRFSNVYLPSRHSEKMGEIIVIGDTSGSITGKELDEAAAEIKAVADQVRPERIRLLWADTRVAAEQVFEEGDLIMAKPAGGGGTDMRVPLTYAEQYEPHVVILITDGYTPWPEVEPPYPLIVLCTTDVAVPVGMVVRVR